MVACPWLQLGNLTITLVENADRESPLDFSEHAMATLLQVDDLAVAYDRATKHGARVIEPPERPDPAPARTAAARPRECGRPKTPGKQEAAEVE